MSLLQFYNTYTTSKNPRKMKLYRIPKKNYNISHVLSQQNSYKFVTYAPSKYPRKIKLYEMPKNSYNISHVLSQQNSYLSFTILKHIHNIEKSEREKVVSNAQKDLKHLTCAFTTKFIRVHYYFKACMQVEKSEKNKIVSSVQNTLQHLACAFTTKFTRVCYNSKARIQH
jgi:hypothetical protein